MKVEIKAQPNVSSTTGYVDFKVSAKGTDDQNNPTEAAAVSTARLQITDAASITVANSNATSTVEKAGNSAELVSFSTTVKDGSYNLKYLEFALTGNVANGTDVELLVDGRTITTKSSTVNGTKVTFDDINETLEAGKHNITLKASIDDSSAKFITVQTVKTSASADAKTLNVKKLFVKAYPTLSLVKKDTSANEVIIKITNPTDSDEDLTISWFTFSASWDVKTMSLNDQSLEGSWDASWTVYSITWSKQVTLAAGEYTEFRFEVAGTQSAPKTAQLKWITVNVDSKDYAISDDYTNVGKWADFKITYKS